MNLNYVGSVAERFFKFRSSLADTTTVSENLFNNVSIYMPKSLASANLSEDSYDADEVTAEKYAVIPVTVDNYSKVLAEGSTLLAQWLSIFNDGANLAVTLYVIVFDDTSFSPIVTTGSISWSPLTKAFKELYFISLFKTMFSEHYDGAVKEDAYDDSNYFDMALCLMALIEQELTLSFGLFEIHVDVPAGTVDSNVCKCMTHTKGEETLHCTTFTGTTKADRAEYFWGYYNLVGGTRNKLILHNGSIMLPIVLGAWFDRPNASGQYIGNKFCKIRLTGNKVKPTGLPSPLNSDVNLNLAESIYTILDDKFIGYFISIADDSLNNAELVSDRTANNYPLTAYAMSKYIDYTCSQEMAKYATSLESLTDPVLADENAYAYLQSLVAQVVSTFNATRRVSDIQITFPPYDKAKKGNTFEGLAVWKAKYVDDLGGVSITGSISF